MDIAGQLRSQGLNLVWTMGMVGGPPLNQAISKSGRTVYNVTSLLPERMPQITSSMNERDAETARRLAASVPEWKTGKVRIVTCVRDPLARNLHAYMRGKAELSAMDDPQGEIDTFVRRYPQQIPLQWFGAEVAPVLGVDVLDHPFDKQRGWSVIDLDHVRILVVRAEIGREEKKAALEALYEEEMPLPDSSPDSESMQERYGEVLGRVTFPRSLISRFYDSRYVWHFWTYTQIDAMQRAIQTVADEAASAQ